MEGITVNIGTTNAAFWLDDDEPNAAEVARILRSLADRIEEEGIDISLPGFAEGNLYDVNGNLCGDWRVIS